MSAPQHLPDLTVYRRELISDGAPAELPLVPYREAGLLAELPAPPKGRRGWPWDRQTPPPVTGVKRPIISIVTPSFQQGAFLEETIRSVLLQNYPSLQFVIMDGGSTDESCAVIERYRPWLSFARSAPDRGQSHAINLGFALTSGTWMGWLNSDDFYLPGALHRVATNAQNRPALLYGDSLAWDQRSRRMRHVMAGFAHARYAAFPGLIPSHGAFWHRAIHQPVWEKLNCSMDYELWVRLLLGTRACHIPHPLGVIREHATAKSHSADFQSRWEEDAKLNGSAHPAIYRHSRLRAAEFRTIQKAVRLWRIRGETGKLEQVRHACGWDFPIMSSRHLRLCA